MPAPVTALRQPAGPAPTPSLGGGGPGQDGAGTGSARSAGSRPASGARPLIRSAARSAIAIVGALVLPLGTAGITEASTTRSPSTPRDAQLGATLHRLAASRSRRPSRTCRPGGRCVLMSRRTNSRMPGLGGDLRRPGATPPQILAIGGAAAISRPRDPGDHGRCRRRRTGKPGRSAALPGVGAAEPDPAAAAHRDQGHQHGQGADRRSARPLFEYGVGSTCHCRSGAGQRPPCG